MKEKILVVDDDDNVHEILEMYLKKENYEILKARNGTEALQKFEKLSPDLIILDIMMPDMDGKEVVKELRKDSQVPIIFLSAKSEEIDRILGLELGADDYVTKPFSPREVVTRVKVILKRVKNSPEQTKKPDKNVLEFPGLAIYLSERKVKVREKIIDLSPKEYELLVLLAQNQNQVFSREKLYNKIWGQNSYGDLRSVDVHINWLRKKLELDYIKTVWGVGYKFEVDTDV